MDIGGEKSGDSIDETSRFYKGSLWTLLNSNFKKMPNYEIYIASFFGLFEVEKVILFFPFSVVLPGGDGNVRPTGKIFSRFFFKTANDNLKPK